MTDFLKGINGLINPNPEPERELEVEIPRLLSLGLSLSDLYPEGRKFNTAARGIISAVGKGNLSKVTLSLPLPISRIVNGELFARYYSPFFSVLSTEKTEENGNTTLTVTSLIGELPSYFFTGFAGLIVRYAVSKDGGKTPSDSTRNPKSRYNSNKGFAVAYGTDYLDISRKYGEKEVPEVLRGIVEKFKASLSPTSPEKPKKG